MKKCHKITLNLLLLLLLVVILLILVFSTESPADPIFSIESTTVKAFNLTADNNLLCIISLGVRARNPNPTEHAFDFRRVDVEVRKGVHHALANDALRDFSLGPASEAVVPAEAVGLRAEVKREIAVELMADLVAGEGRVNVFLSGNVGSDGLGVTCKNVAVDISRLTVKAQRVDCEITMTPPTNYLRVFVSSLIVGCLVGMFSLFFSPRVNS